MMSSNKERRGDRSKSRSGMTERPARPRRFVEGLEARTLLSTAAHTTPIVVTPHIAIEAASSVSTIHGTAAGFIAVEVGAPDGVNGAQFPVGTAGLPAAIINPHNDTNLASGPAVLVAQFERLAAGLGFVATLPQEADVVVVPGSPAMETIVSPPLEGPGPRSSPLRQSDAVQPERPQAISPMAPATAAILDPAHLPAAPTESGDAAGSAANGFIAAHDAVAITPPVIEQTARDVTGSAPAFGAAAAPARAPGVASGLWPLPLIASATESAIVGPPPTSVVLSPVRSLSDTPLAGLVDIALPTIAASTLFSETPLRLVEPAMTALPGLLLGLAPTPAGAAGGDDGAGRGWEIAAAASLGVAAAGYWYASRAERDAQEAPESKAQGVRRVRGGWELVPLERR